MSTSTYLWPAAAAAVLHHDHRRRRNVEPGAGADPVRTIAARREGREGLLPAGWPNGRQMVVRRCGACQFCDVHLSSMTGRDKRAVVYSLIVKQQGTYRKRRKS